MKTPIQREFTFQREPVLDQRNGTDPTHPPNGVSAAVKSGSQSIETGIKRKAYGWWLLVKNVGLLLAVLFSFAFTAGFALLGAALLLYFQLLWGWVLFVPTVVGLRISGRVVMLYGQSCVDLDKFLASEAEIPSSQLLWELERRRMVSETSMDRTSLFHSVTCLLLEIKKPIDSLKRKTKPKANATEASEES